MITYEPFWKKCEEVGENWYTLHHKHGISFSTLHRIKNNKPLSTVTINDLCKILHCDIVDVLKYTESEDDQPL